MMLVAPDDFVAPVGQLIPINRLHPPSPADEFRCIGCTKPECQVCARMALGSPSPGQSLPRHEWTGRLLPEQSPQAAGRSASRQACP